MFFGLCNSPATFQAMMDSIFEKLVDGNVIIIYMDDILIFTKNKEDLERYTKQVLQILWDNDLFLKPTKCEFCKTKIEYLGMVISEGTISMDPIKLWGICDWPIPSTIKHVRSFLGFGNFYWKFIRGFSDIVHPLNNLLRKDVLFLWDQDCQSAFDMLKQRFTEEPILSMPDHSRPFQIESDASKYASGAILTQMDSNGNCHPVSFISKTFNDTERNYEIYDRELLGIIRALEEWQHYIQGSGHTTVIFSDHKNLTYFCKAQKLSPRQAHWSLFLSQYDLNLTHIAGNKLVLANALSCCPDYIPEVDTNNENLTLLPDSLFVHLIDVDLQH